jgi:hypothetical protein
MKKIKYILLFMVIFFILNLNSCKDPEETPEPEGAVAGVEVIYNGITVQNGGKIYVELDDQTTTISVSLLPEDVAGRVVWEPNAGFNAFAQLTPATGFALTAAIRGVTAGDTGISFRAFNQYNGDRPVVFQFQVGVRAVGDIPIQAFNVLNGGAIVADGGTVSLFTDTSLELTAQLFPASVNIADNVTWTYASNAYADLSSNGLSLNMTGKTKGSFDVSVTAENQLTAVPLTRTFTVNVVEPPTPPNVWVERQWTQYSGNLTCVAFGNGVFAAGGTIAGRSIWAAEDMVWTAASHDIHPMHRMIFTGGRFIGISSENSTPNPATSVSTDGKTWDFFNDNLGAAHGIATDGGNRIIIGGWSGAARTSINNGASWSVTNLFSHAEAVHRSATVRGFAYGEGNRVVGIGNPLTANGIIVYNNMNGFGAWTTAYTGTVTLNSIVYAHIQPMV